MNPRKLADVCSRPGNHVNLRCQLAFSHQLAALGESLLGPQHLLHAN
jgi:hypothetical protein